MTHSYVHHILRVSVLEHVVKLMSHIWTRDMIFNSSSCNDSFLCVTWLTHMCHMTYSYMSHDSFICAPWPARSSPWARSKTHVTHMKKGHDAWLIHMCDMMHSDVWRDSFICVTWFIHMCDLRVPLLERVVELLGLRGRYPSVVPAHQQQHRCLYTHTHTHTHT